MIDPLSQPIATLIPPFTVQDLKGETADQIKLLKYCKKEVDLDQKLYTYLHSKREVMRIEVRCVRIDGYKNLNGAADDLVDAEMYNHAVGLNRDSKEEPQMQWPSRGYFSFNMMMQTQFKVPKRRDEVTEWSLLAGIGYERELRYERA